MSVYKPIPTVRVSAIDYPIYSVDYTAGIDSQPSEFKISFISENGEYEQPKIGLLFPVTIQIGNEKYSYFAIESFIRKAPRGGNILDVTFVDASFVLDKIWVGLKNKHGESSQYPMIIVGSEVSPCDEDETTVNPCDPCDRVSYIECTKQSKERILDVRYNIIELLDAVQDFGYVEFENRPPNSVFIPDGQSTATYYNRYTGTLREVLKSWLSDYGLTFYWTKDDKIKFIDLREGFEINTKTLDTQEDVVAKTVGQSLRSTTCNGIIAHYAQDRQEIEYNCGGSSYTDVLMTPLNLNVLGSEIYFSEYNMGGTNGSYRGLEICSLLSNYSPVLRDLFVLKEIYGLKSYADIKSKVGRTYPLLGNLKIVKVLSKDADSFGDRQLFQYYLEAIAGSLDVDNPSQAQQQIENGSIYGNNFCIVIAEQDEALKQKYIDYEIGLAQNFFGKYYIRRYGRNARHTSFSAPSGASVQFYEARKNYYADLPFLQYMKNYNLTTNRLGGEALFSVSSDGGEVLTNDSFLLLERNAPTIPLPNERNLEKIIEFGTKNNYEETAYLNPGVLKKLGTNKKAFIFKDIASSVNIEFTGTTKNSLDADKLDLKFKQGSIIRNWGLRDNGCLGLAVKIGNSQRLQIRGPSQAYVRSTGTGWAGYIVIGNNNGNSLKQIIPKQEVVKTKFGDGTSGRIQCVNTMRTSMIIKEIKEELTNVLDSKCLQNKAQIEALIDSYLNKLNFPIDKKKETKEYTIKGLSDDEFSIEDGLKSFNISIGDDGLKTTLSFESIQPSLEATDVIVKNFESYVEQYLRGRNPNFGSQNTFQEPNSINDDDTRIELNRTS